MSTMSEIIRERRQALGITQRELADMLSISDKTVSRWESANQMPDAILLPDLAEALKISINDLYGISSTEKETEVKAFPRPKPYITVSYKAAMIIGLVLFLFGAILLVHINTIRFDTGDRALGNIFMYIGSGLCLAAEIVYIVLYRNKFFYNPVYLFDDIRLGNTCALSILAVLIVIFPMCLTLRITYLYELLVVLLLVATMVMMIFQKRSLRAEGINTSKIISIITVSVISLCILIMAGVYVYFRFIYKDPLTENDPMMQLLIELAGESPYEVKARMYSFMLLAAVMLSLLLMNHIELIIKSKRHHTS